MRKTRSENDLAMPAVRLHKQAFWAICIGWGALVGSLIALLSVTGAGYLFAHNNRCTGSPLSSDDGSLWWEMVPMMFGCGRPSPNRLAVGWIIVVLVAGGLLVAVLSTAFLACRYRALPPRGLERLGARSLIAAVGGMIAGGAVILAWGLESGLLRGVYEGFVGFVLSWGVALTLVVVGVVWAAVERIVASRRGAIR